MHASRPAPPCSHHPRSAPQAQLAAVLERTRQLPVIHPPPSVDLSCEELMTSPDQLIATGGRIRLLSGANLPRRDSESMFWQELASSLDDKTDRDIFG